MDSKAIEIYMMIGSHEPIITWLKEAGITKKDAASQMLRGAFQSNIIGAIIHESNGAISASSNTIKRVLEAFDD